MNDQRFELLRRAKRRLVAADALSPEARRLHTMALRLVYEFRPELGLSDEQFRELIAAPQGGGTNKPPPEED